MKNFNLIEMAKAMKEHKLRHMWRYAAMIFAVLVMSIANVGMAWGADATISPSESATASYYFAADGTAITAIAGSGGHDAAYNKGTPKFKLRGTTGKNVITFDFTIGTGITITSFKVNGTKGSNTNAALDGSSVTFGTALTGLSKTSSMSFTLTCTDGTSSSTNRETTISSFTLTYTTSGGGGGGGGDECSSPSFSTPPTSASYAVGASATNLTATATATNPGTITYKWQKSTNYGSTYSDIDGATNQTYKPSTSTAGITYYRSVASFSGGCSDTNSDAAIVAVKGSNSGTMSGSDYICFKNKTANNTATSATTSNSTALTSLSGQLTGDGKGDKSAMVAASTGQTYSFTVASGYTFDPTYIGFKGSYVGSGAPTQMTFTYELKNSSSETLCSGTFVQATHANTAPLDTIYKGSIDITPLEAGTYTLKITGSQDKNVANNFRLGNWVTIKGTVASSCSAPTAVYVTQTDGSPDMIAGESFTLSAATSTGVADGATYEWYRGSTPVGTNSATYTVASCTATDAGTYWCKITNPCSEDAHTTNVTGYGLKVWQVLLYSSSWNAYDLTSTGTKTGTLSRRLTPGTYYIKLTHNNGVDFGVNTGGTISEITATTPSAWTLYGSQNNIKLTVTTAGYYTFDVDYTSANNPTLSVTFPSATISSCDKIYFCPSQNSIATGSAKFSIYFWNDTESGWASCYLVDGTNYADDANYVAFAPSTTNGWQKMIVVRDDAYASSFDGIWNQSQDISYNGYDYIVGTGWSDSKFTNNLNSFYSSTTPAMGASSYATTVDGTTNASTNLTGATISYASDNTSVASVNSSGVITGVAVGETTITASVGSCTVGSATVTVSRNTPTQYTVSGTTSICSGSNTNITLSGSETGASYQLKKGGVAEGDAKAGTGSSLTWSVSAAGTYTVSAVQTAKYTARDMSGSAVITVNTPVTISWNNAPANGTIGGSMTASVTTNYAAGVTYAVTSASPAGCVTIHETSGAISYVAAGTATITATVTGAGNYCSSANVTQSVTVNKKTPTKYDFSVNKTVLCGEETATLTLEDSEDGVTYELREDSSHPIADTEKSGTGSALTWTGLGAGTYVVYAVADATYTERQMNSSKITVTTGTATSITTQPTNQEVTVDEEATLTVVAAGTSLSYQWKESATEDGTYSNVASSGTSASYSVTPAAAGTKWYKCVITGTCGEVTTEARKIVANAAVTYTVTYDAQGGSVTPTSEDVSTATLPTPTKTDYTFQGWYTSGGTLISGTYNPTADITLHALWREDECSGGGGGGSTTLISITPTITNDNKNNGSASASGTPGGTAYWDKMGTSSPYKLNRDGAYFALKLSSGYYQATDVLVINGADKAHYVYYGSHGSGTALSATGNPSSNTINFTLTGLPSSVDEIYVYRSSDSYNGKLSSMSVTRAGGGGTCYYVTYNGNGADGGFTKDEASHASGSNVTVASNSFTKTGYTFTGWNTEAEGTGTPYTASGTISGISGNMTLYAQWEEEVACSTDPTVTAGSNSAVTSTTATVSCASGISSLGTGGCTITSYGFVIGTSTNPVIDGVGVTQHEVGTSIAASTAFSKDLTGLTKNTTYYVRPYATNGFGTAYGTETSFTTTAAAATYTVTYNAQGGSVTPSSETVSTATLPTPTKSGYTFDGWYTSGGSKITGTYNPTADITLYAQWQSTDCDAGGTTTLVDINFKDATWSGKTFSQGNTDTEDLIKGVYFWCKDATKHFSLEDNTSKGLTFPADNMSSNNRYFCIPITGINSSNKQITVTLKHGYSSSTASFKYYYNDGRTEWVDASAGSGTSVSDAQKSDTEITFTLNNSGKGLTNTAGHLFIGRNSSSFTNIYGVTVTTPGAAGTCYYVTYNGNGATGGYTTDEAAYASRDNATAATNSFTKTGYTFKEWRTNPNGTGTKYEAGDPIAISGDITLYAIWQAAGYTLAWNTNGGSALAGDYSSGSFADGATITAPNDPTRANYTFDSWNTAGDGTGNAYTGTMPAANTTYYAVWKNTLTLKTGSQGSESDKSPTVFLDGSRLNGFSAHKAAGYTLQGYYTAATGGTKVLNADGSFAASNIARFVTSGKWSRTTGDTILVAQWESSYLLKWNLQLDKAEDAISTTSKESATARITTASMTNLTNNGELTITGSKKSNLTSKIETPINLSVAESKYMSVSFGVTAGYQLLPSAVKVMVQPVGDGENKYAKLILEDENSHSISTVVTCEGTEKGKKTTVTLSNAGGTVFTGTVTLKILVYNASGASTTNNCYRLGSPIQIDGAIEAACELPSYEGMEYDQTEYTVGGDEASAIRVTGGSADTYKWKWNSTNDRSTGTEVGTNDASYTPLTTISEVGTRYYWCELTNVDCDGVVKTPAVAITVRANKSEASVTWTDPANEPNYGGGGYVIRATMNSGYDGELSAEDLTAPAGIRITNVSIDNEADQKYIEATFDVTTAFNRDENSKISFTLSHDATTGYDAISDEHDVDYDACSGGEEGSAAIALTSAIHDEGSGNAPRYWFETSGVGRVFGINYGKATLGTSSDAAFSTEGYSYVASSTSQRWVFQPYVEGVTKIRIYIKSATNTLKVLSIGKNASWQDQSSKYSNIAVDTIIYSNGKTTGLDNNQKGYAEIQFSSALTKNNYYMITMSSSSTYIYGVTLYSGSVGDGGNLPTSLTFANTGPIEADASTANFQNIASKSGENSNTLGTITYSSNNDAATVNATTGEVSIHAKGTAQAVTITATLSASGCYQGATATYTINVAADECGEPSGSIDLTTGSATKCSGESVILTMTGFTSGATVEWYNGDTKVNGTSGYTIVTSGSTSTLTTSNDGTYSAIAKVDGGCANGAGRTNSITISDISVDASATKIVDKWYVKNGRSTPDIALWQLSEGATLDEVTIERNVSGEGSLGLTSSDFVARDGIVYLSGKEPSANETGADVEYTLTLTVKDACDGEHEMTEKTITLTHQKNTDKHVLAFVVNGTAKGGFTDGITAAQTTSVGLYNAIAAQFDVLATNIYATDDEKKLKEYYSQFDILCITDYPNTQTKGANSKSYVDAIGSLIDIRPILTMEAFVSKLANWKAKGISGNPKSPTTRQYTMLLQCKDHEIFSGTERTKVGEGDETMYRVSMVDSTKEDYATLDATYGATLPHKEKESKSGAGDGEYNYGGKPALQGFTFTQEMSDNDLLPIGLINDGAGNPLQVGIERQHNMEARLMVLGINSYAMERLTDDGERIVINALKYLMKKNSEDIADCSNTFVGGDDEEDVSTRYDWNVDSHWSGNAVPERTQKVRIVAPCVIKAGEKFHVTGVVIAPSGKYNHGANTASGSLTIAAGGALVVDGKVEAATAPLYTETRATSASDLTIGSDESNGNGTLIFDNSEGESQAIVQYYSKANTNEDDVWNWQYMAVPFNDNSSAYRNYYDSYLYRWKEDCSGWEIVPNGGEVYPWVGYTITQVGDKTYTMDGTLVETGEQTFSVPAGKNLVLGNSWTAPIQVKQFTDDDFAHMSKNVYLFNTGYDKDGEGSFSGTRYEGGTYVTIPIHSSPYTGDSLISSLQAFIVYAKADEGGGTFTLDYDRHVRPARSTDKVNAGKMHAPKRGGVINDKPAVLKVWASGSRYDDRLIVLEREDFSTGLDEGWDGNKRVAGNSSPLIFAVTDNGREAVSAIPTMEGTLIGFWAGEDNEYTLHFEYEEEDELYLLDLDNNIYTPVNSNSTYVFTVPDKKAHNRFILTRNTPDPVATGVEETQANEKPEAKAIKFLKDEKVFIFVNGKLYDATGKIVK